MLLGLPDDAFCDDAFFLEPTITDRFVGFFGAGNPFRTWDATVYEWCDNERTSAAGSPCTI